LSQLFAVSSILKSITQRHKAAKVFISPLPTLKVTPLLLITLFRFPVQHTVQFHTLPTGSRPSLPVPDKAHARRQAEMPCRNASFGLLAGETAKRARRRRSPKAFRQGMLGCRPALSFLSAGMLERLPISTLYILYSVLIP
jgi:hypothetical protein